MNEGAAMGEGKRVRVGFDVGGTNARLMIFGEGDERDEGLSEVRERIREHQAPGELAQVMAGMLARGLKEVEAQAGGAVEIEAVGVGLAGQLDRGGRVVRNAPNLGWRDVAFGEVLEGAFREATGRTMRVVLVNDLNAQVLGEIRAGAAKGARDVLAIYVGTGVGGAVVADGHLVLGGGNAGEVGHSKVVVGGRRCGCGQRGCVEAYAGGLHLERRLREAAAQAPGDELLAAIAGGERVDLGTADQYAHEHEGIGEIWEEATDYLSMVMANGVTLLNPEVLLIGGGVLENCAYFRGLLMRKTVPLILEVAVDGLAIKLAEISSMSGMLGAAEYGR